MNQHKQDEIAGVRLSNPDKVLFAGQGATKAELAAHYERVAARMLPHVENRLVSFVRCPDGDSGQCFYQRHGGMGLPDAIKRLEILEKDGGRDDYLYVDHLKGIIAAVQMSVLEFHIWGSRIGDIERPDRLVFDLDPDEALGFADVRRAAFAVRDRLEALGLKSVALVTGGKGIHVLAPLECRAEWPQVKQFARGLAMRMASEDPERYVAQAAKEKRVGRIYIDWLRNERSATAIAPYSTRAKAGAPVATPVSWDELEAVKAANSFGIGDIVERLARPDPWAQSAEWRQAITGDMLDAVG